MVVVLVVDHWECQLQLQLLWPSHQLHHTGSCCCCHRTFTAALYSTTGTGGLLSTLSTLGQVVFNTDNKMWPQMLDRTIWTTQLIVFSAILMILFKS